MKVSYIQIFDVLSEAEAALGRVVGWFPENENRLIDNNSQVQVFSKIDGVRDAKAYGDLDDNIIYLVMSITH